MLFLYRLLFPTKLCYYLNPFQLHKRTGILPGCPSGDCLLDTRIFCLSCVLSGNIQQCQEQVDHPKEQLPGFSEQNSSRAGVMWKGKLFKRICACHSSQQRYFKGSRAWGAKLFGFKLWFFHKSSN